MKKNLLLYILLGFLVIMNGFFLFNHFKMSGKSDSKRPAPANFIAKQLDFDASQLQQFKRLEGEHHEKMRYILDDVRELKQSLFDKITEENTNPSDVESLTTLIAEKEKAKELETFLFFHEVGKLCNRNQKERFKFIVKDALHRQGPPSGRDAPPRGRPGEEGRPPPPEH